MPPDSTLRQQAGSYFFPHFIVCWNTHFGQV